MKTIKIFLTILVLASVCVLSSCDKEKDEPKPPTQTTNPLNGTIKPSPQD